MPRNPHKTPCGTPGCRAWAIRGSDPPRCSAHRHTTAIPNPAAGATGQPSLPNPATSPAGPHVGAPLGNQNRLVHGFYAQALDETERHDTDACATDATLDAEIAITRIALRRILGMLHTGLTPGPNPVPLNPHDYARYAELAFRGASTVARLLRARQALSGGFSAELEAAIEQAHRELSEELGVNLTADPAPSPPAYPPDPGIEPQNLNPDARGPGGP